MSYLRGACIASFLLARTFVCSSFLFRHAPILHVSSRAQQSLVFILPGMIEHSRECSLSAAPAADVDPFLTCARFGPVTSSIVRYKTSVLHAWAPRRSRRPIS